MHIEDSPSEPTPDIAVATVPTLRDEAEQQMNQFTHWDDYDVHRITGSKQKTEIIEQPSVRPSKKRQGKKTERTSLDFASAEAIPEYGGRA